LIVSHVENPQAVAQALTSANRSPVRITIPKSGASYELLKLCERNYAYRVFQSDTK
jgi:excinuclease UvrABC nuclease subunit